MGDVTALMMDVITEKSGHAVTPMAVSVCLTPAAPAPLPIPYPVFATSIEGIGDAPMRTKINGAKIGTVGSVLKTCHGNEPGTLKEVVSLNTTGPCFLVLGAPIVLCELGMMGITGSLCMQNKAPTPGAGGTASNAGGAGGPGGGGGEGSGGGGDASGPGGPGGGGGAGGGGSNTGASGPGASSGAAEDHQCQDGHPVDIATGHVVDSAVDLTLPGVIPLLWKRTYSSSRRSDRTSTLGPGWAHGFEQRITEEEDTTTLRDAGGRLIWFAPLQPGQSTFHRRERMTLSREGNGLGYRLRNHTTRRILVFAPETAGAPILLRSIQDAHENSIVLEYDGARLTRLTDTAGREVRASWKQGRIARLEVRVEGRLEQWVDYGYSASGCLVTVTDALGHTDEYEYDVHCRMLSTTVKNGVRFQYEYESGTGRCKRTWGAGGLYAIELSADVKNRTTLVDGEEPRLFTWNADGLMVREETPDGVVLQERAYDEDGYLVAAVNGAGEGMQYWYDAAGQCVRQVDAAGNVATFDYQDNLLVRRTGPEGTLTHYAYDADGDVSHVALPTGESLSLSYDHKGRMTAIESAGALLRGFEYDARHDVIAEVDARGARTTFAYDAMGRPVARTDALGRTTRAAYDRLGRRIMLYLPDGTTTQHTLDAMGNVIRSVDALGQATTMDYGGLGVITRLTNPNGQSFTFKYTSKERLREIQNPRGEKYTFSYDLAGRLVQETTFDGRSLHYHYTSAGRLERIDYPDRTCREFTYGRLGELLSDQSSDGDIAYRRDRLGRLLGATLEERGHRSTTLFERDLLGRVTAEIHADRRVRYEYDSSGRRTLRVLPNGETTRYAYDPLDSLTSVEHNGHLLAFGRDAVGREVQRRSGADVVVKSVRDALDRLVEMRAIAPAPLGEAVLVTVQRQWHYDKQGRPQRIDDSRRDVVTYRHDRAGQLLEATSGARREVFEYDAAGALRSALDTIGQPHSVNAAWEIDAGDRVTRTSLAKYAYDERGRRAGRRALASKDPSREEMDEYRWDTRDRLREIRLASGRRVLFTYDALGRRTRKEVLSDSGASHRSVDFIWDGDVVAADIDSDRGVRTFVHEPGTLFPLLQQERDEVLTYVTDHLGTPKELLDPAGRVVWSATHSAWGSALATSAGPALDGRSGGKVSSPFRLLGQYADEETGLCSTRFRYFDPEVARWCSPDPLGIEGGLDQFGFNGSPAVVVDPFGLSTSFPMVVPSGSAGSAPGTGTVGAGRISAATLGSQIPAGTPNTWNPSAPATGGYSGAGFRYRWTVPGTPPAPDTKHEVWGHGPNPNAPAGSNAATGPTVRIKNGNRYVTTSGHTVRNAEFHANDTHIPLDP